MSLRSVFCGLIFVGASFPGAARADSPRATCFAKHVPTRVLPYRSEKWVGQAAHTALAGVRVFIWAEPGLTGEWLHYQLAQRLAQRGASGDCPLDVPGVSIRVLSAGPGFWLDISAKEGAQAEEVLRRARAIIPE
jgi:hypothetical protein